MGRGWSSPGPHVDVRSLPLRHQALLVLRQLSGQQTGGQWVALRRQSLPLLRYLGGQQVEQQEVVLRRQALPRAWRQALPPL